MTCAPSIYVKGERVEISAHSIATLTHNSKCWFALRINLRQEIVKCCVCINSMVASEYFVVQPLPSPSSNDTIPCYLDHIHRPIWQCVGLCREGPVIRH